MAGSAAAAAAAICCGWPPLATRTGSKQQQLLGELLQAAQLAQQQPSVTAPWLASHSMEQQQQLQAYPAAPELSANGRRQCSKLFSCRREANNTTARHVVGGLLPLLDAGKSWRTVLHDSMSRLLRRFGVAGAAAGSPLVPSWPAVLFCISLFVTQVRCCSL
jgi:hypothetical protein